MRLIAAAVSVILLVAVVACRDSTGPEPPFSISVSIKSSTGPTFVDFDTLAQIECDVTLQAVARGPGTATWGGGTFYTYFGPDRATPLDSGTLSAATIRQSWGDSTIDSTQAREAQWRLSASIPFDLAFAFTYRRDNGQVTRTSPLKFTCGPPIPAGVGPPKFTTLTASPPTGDIESGDTLTVTYAVSSPIGIWEAAVEVGGACTISRVFPEHLATTATRTVSIVIPPQCLLGSALNVTARAYDAAAQGVETSLATLTLVDRTPPRARVWVDWLYPSSLGPFVLGGDSLLVTVSGSDNHALSAEFWQLQPAGAIDSLLTSLPAYGRQRTIPVPDSTPGKALMRAWSRDATGLVSDTAIAPPDSVRVIPSRSHAIRASAVIPEVGAMTVAERRGMVYAVIGNPPQILGISVQSLAVTATIPLPVAAGDIDVTPSDDSLVVTLPDRRAVGIIDLTAASPTVAMISLPSMAAGNWPGRVRTLANGHVFVTVGGDPATQTLLELNVQTGVDRVRTDAGANGVVGPAVLERSYDHRIVAVDARNNIPARLQRYDLGTDAFGSSLVHDAWFQPAVDGTGTHIALGTTVYDAALNIERAGESPALGRGLFPVALSFDGTSLFHTIYPFGLLRDSVANGELVERTRLTFYAPYLLRTSSDGKTIIVYDSQNSRIVVIDLP
jgi:hypothetical protein